MPLAFGLIALIKHGKTCSSNQYYSLSDNNCNYCPTNCSTCNNNTYCTSCVFGSWFNPILSTCDGIPNCAVNQYYRSSDNSCNNCPVNCSACTNNTKCSACATGFINNSITTSCDLISNCSNGQYYLAINNTCAICPSPCTACISNTTCLSCNSTYWFNVSYSSCDQITSCYYGQYYKFLTNSCIACPSKCTSCLNETFCYSCAIGYLLNNLTSYCDVAPPLSLTKNQITIKQGKNITIDSAMIYAVNGSQFKTIQFIVSNLVNGIFVFKYNSLVSINNFTINDIQNNIVIFKHDGSQNTPTFNITAYDGFYYSSDQTSLVSSQTSFTFYLLPVITVNQLTIKQCKTVYFTTTNLYGQDVKLPLVYVISNLYHGKFICIDNPISSILSFTHNQLINNKIQFIHDGSITQPNYSITIDDGTDLSNISNPSINFTILPYMTLNQLTIKQSKEVVLNIMMINALWIQAL